ncbi:MAG: hypothetical protein COA96_06985 [SAR86 cluster bacterium]|uniref:Uncharacterized protein n=1 Tax=SAR86 cluster bacterium TaxID=2030880 RepID=A0A2A5B2H0_9GAMM|nr:MAG: hypothetical protein COA96_06985 [SAR86 cluster bacterium]
MILIPVAVLTTLRYENRNNDGPSILFPGGELTSGSLHTGPEPDWKFTDQISTVDLQLYDPLSSRLIWIEENEGKIYVTSDYMGTWLGRLWKHWAVEAYEGDGLALVRIEGVLYERKLVRVLDGSVLDGIIAKKIEKYRSRITREAIESGETWVFELAPRSGV